MSNPYRLIFQTIILIFIQKTTIFFCFYGKIFYGEGKREVKYGNSQISIHKRRIKNKSSLGSLAVR